MRDLHLTSPLMYGPDVLAVQRKLRALGYNPGPLDGRYGTLTYNAVRLFQAKHKITVDGIFGTRTRAALAAAKPPVKPPAKPASKGVRALAEAVKHVGVREQPAGSNRNPFGKWFGVDGVPWCAEFVSYAFSVGAAVTICKGFKAPGCYPQGCAYVPTLEAWLRQSGQWAGRVAPKPGDIAIFNWDGGVADHVGIVEKNLGGGLFQTIEGNTAVGNDSNGGQVLRRTRSLTQVDGFGRIT